MKIFLDTSIVIDVLAQRQDFYTKDIFYGDIDDFHCVNSFMIITAQS